MTEGAAPPNIETSTPGVRELEVAKRDAEFAAQVAHAEVRKLRDSRVRRRRVFEAVAGFTAPPLVGIAILAMVFAGIGSEAILDSAAATSTALVVGALLMLVPPVLFALSPDRYAMHQTDVERRISEFLARETTD